jgi:hypothetical protein
MNNISFEPIRRSNTKERKKEGKEKKDKNEKGRLRSSMAKGQDLFIIS